MSYADRTQETCSSPGTGPASLLGAVPGAFQPVSASYVNGHGGYYQMNDGVSNFETGWGHYVSSGNQWSRDMVLTSTNANALVNFTAAIVYIWIDVPAAVVCDLGTALAMHMMDVWV